MSQQQPPKTITDIIKPELPNLMALLSLNNEAVGNSIETIALQELSYLEQHALAKPEILGCHPLSIITAVRTTLRKNLSLDPSAGLTYIKTRKTQINGAWVEVLEIQDTCNGKLSYYRQLGRILDFTRPKVQKNEKGRVIGVSMRLLLPSVLGPRWEDFDYDESDFKRWATYSHKERSRNKQDANATTLNYANQLYRSWEGGIDPEFSRAKCINHSLKKLGANPNEGILMLPKFPDEKANAVDASTAMAETADENGEFAWHEEVNSKVNEAQDVKPTNNHDEQDFSKDL
jgi:hypothetical protein